MADPRLLVIMGSGETAPTMARVHRKLFNLLGPDPVPAAIIDTPYGFQENADELSARTVRFFGERLGRAVGVASYRTRDVDAVTAATAIARLREARFIMAGPGSPSYALRHWADGPIPSTLADRLRTGGILTMASAAALTLGAVTIPVYEIYKVGAAPHWLPGLDLLGLATGLRAAIVPHFDNAEGGTHDTRFCYMGERRMDDLDRQLPEGTFVIGVDSHTALVFDLDRATASVAGRGGVTVRARGRSTVFPSGSEVEIATLADTAVRLAGGSSVDVDPESAPPGFATVSRAGSASLRTDRTSAPGSERGSDHPGPIQLTVADLEGAFVDATGRDDRRGAVAALLDLDLALAARTRGGEDSPDLDDARSTFRALIARLGTVPDGHEQGLEARFERLVGELLAARTRAREACDWGTADLIRSALGKAGVEVRDEVAGSA